MPKRKTKKSTGGKRSAVDAQLPHSNPPVDQLIAPRVLARAWQVHVSTVLRTLRKAGLTVVYISPRSPRFIKKGD